MDASRPLLAGDDNDNDEIVTRPTTSSICCRSSGNETLSAKSMYKANGDHVPYFFSSNGKCEHTSSEHDWHLCSRSCSKWPCWKWIFPSRIGEYEDFATAAQMGEIYALRQTARKQFEPTLPEDDKMLQHLWDGLYPTLPYEGRVNVRWRDVGFQNDDPASDLRTSGRLAIQMLLYFSDHLNDEFKRIIRENRFPMCICALNLLEVLLCHLKLKEPLPLVCPCCGTENAELETSKKPSQTHPELCGFIALVEDASAHQISFSGGGPAETALAHIFVHSLLVMDGVWKQQLQRDPTTTLMHFREALVETRVRIVAFLSRRQMRLTLKELDKWGYRQRARCQ
ncbi:putative ELMO domain-containing protein [Plasmopara halstedii]